MYNDYYLLNLLQHIIRYGKGFKGIQLHTG